MIWEYQDRAGAVPKQAIAAERCIYCHYLLRSLPGIYETDANYEEKFMGGDYEVVTEVYACPRCGWWKLLRARVFEEHDEDPDSMLQERHHTLFASIGSLRELDISDLHAPVGEVRRYLAARYEERFNVHPRLFEETVASVFASIGYRTRLTGYSRDGGIDVILDGPNNSLIGVQVKRYRNGIGVEQIRSFTGALILGDYTAGIFVATSDFTKTARDTTLLAAARGIPIQLLDAEKFYDALSIGQRTEYLRKDDNTAAFRGISFSNLVML